MIKFRWQLLFLVGASTIFFLSHWVITGVYLSGDVLTFMAPLEDMYRHAQLQARIPIWVPEIHGGYPLLSQGQLGYWYLPHMALRHFFNGVTTLNLSLLLHSILGAIGMWVLVKTQKIGDTPAITAGLLFAFGAAMSARFTHIGFVLPLAWLPLILAVVQHYFKSGQVTMLLVWIILQTLQIISGHPHAAALSLIIELIWIIILIAKLPRIYNRLFSMIGAGVIVVGLSLPHTMPIIDILSASDRVEGVSDNEHSTFTFPLSALVGTFVPHPYGHGIAYQGPPNEAELALYLGPVAVAAALISLWPQRRSERSFIYLGLTALFTGLMLAPGHSSPIYRLVVDYTPLAFFGVPQRYSILIHVGLVILASVGIEKIIKKSRYVPYASAIFLLLTIMPVMIVAWTWDQNSVPLSHIARPKLLNSLKNDQSLRILARANIGDSAPSNNFGISLGTPISSEYTLRQTVKSPYSVITGITLELSRSQMKNNSQEFVKLEILDQHQEKLRDQEVVVSQQDDIETISFAFEPILDALDKELILDVSSTSFDKSALMLKQHNNPDGFDFEPTGQLFQCATGDCWPIDNENHSTDAAFTLLTNPPQSLLARELLSPNISAGFNVPTAQWTGALPINQVMEYRRAIGEEDTGVSLEESRQLVDRFGITHFITLQLPNQQVINLTNVTEQANFSWGKYQLVAYKNNQSLPLIHFARHVIAEPKPDKQMDLLSAELMKSSQTVVADIPNNATFEANGKTEIIKKTSDSLTLAVEQNTEGFLVIRDLYYPGWIATIDGYSAQIVRTDALWRGIIVPGGNHILEFKYQPPWVTKTILGFAASVLTLLLISMNALWPFRKSRLNLRILKI